MARKNHKLKKNVFRPSLGLDRFEDRLAPAAFTPGNLVVFRVGDGVLTYGSAGTATPGNITGTTGAPIVLDEYTTAGTLVQSIPMPTTTSGSQLRVVGSLNSTSEGHLSISGDGQYVTFGGYDAAISQAASVVTSTSNPRVLARIKYDGTVDTSTTIDAFAGGNIRDVVTNNGNQFWAAGSNGGVRYASTFGANNTATPQINSVTNMRTVEIFGGRLYYGTGSGTTGVYTSSTPLPIVSGGTDSPVATVGPSSSSSPHAFVYLDMDGNAAINDGDRIYISDDNATPRSVQRFVFASGSWGTGTQIASTQTNLRGLTGRVVAGNAELFATVSTTTIGTNSSYSTSIVTLTDNGTANAASTWSPLATPVSFTGASSTASPVRQFRGIAFVPTAPAGVNTTTSVTSVSPLNIDINQNVTFTASVTAASGTTTPTGSVQFRSGSTIFGSVSVTGSGATGTATLVSNTVPAGTYSNIVAIYSPLDNAFVGSTSAVFGSTLTVTAIPTTTSLSSSAPNPSPGPNITFTATVAGSSTPTGTVDFFANGTKLNDVPVALSGGVANISVPTALIQSVDNKTLTPGINDISAVYNPTGIFLTSSKSIPQKVQANAFTQGNILVYRTGDGVNAMTANGNRFYIDEYLPGAGQTDPVQSILLPTIADGDNKPVLASGVQSTEGDLTLSPDGKYAYFTAYNAPPTNTGTLTFTSGTSIPRVVGRLNLTNGAIETSMGLTDLASGGAVRTVAVAVDGSLYASGASGGIRYISAYNAATTTSTDLGNGNRSFSSLAIFGSTPQLYSVSLPNTTTPVPPPPLPPKLATVGTGLPTTGTQTLTAFPGIPLDNTQPSPNPEFPVEVVYLDLNATAAFDASGVDTIYISNNGPSFTAGTITKWSWDTTTSAWVLNGSISPPLGGTPNVDNTFNRITAVRTDTGVNLFFNNGAGGNNNGGGTIWSLTDTAGYNAAFSTTTLTQIAQLPLGSNKTYRGIAVVPAAVSPPAAPVVSGIIVNNSPSAATQRSRLTKVEVNFANPVDLAQFSVAGAVFFQRTGVADNGVEPLNTLVNIGNGLIVAPAVGIGSSITLTFQNIDNAGLDFGSLSDGRWTLNVVPASYSQSPGNQLRRLFGDADNNGTVDGTDFGFFPPFGAVVGNPFDFNNNNDVDANDFSEFGNRIGVTLT